MNLGTVVAALYGVIVLVSLLILRTLSSADKVDAVQSYSDRLVSVIIPARNEAHNITRCLDSIRELDYANYEVIVVDGGSSDGTREIVSGYSDVILIDEPERPEGWVGKSWACHIGQQRAKGDILLFTDADTEHTSLSLSTAVHHLGRSQGFVTGVTTQQLRSFWEKLLLIVFFIGIVSIGGLKQREGYAFANGQYMMFERSFYDGLGDQGAYYEVRSSVVDDFAIGTLIATQGKEVSIISCPNLVTARMYSSFSEIRSGFAKNLATGASSLDAAGFFRANLVVNWGILGFVLPAVGLLFDIEGSGRMIASGVVGMVLFMLVLGNVERSATDKSSYAPLFYPFYLLVYQFIVLESMYHTSVRKQVSWKGRVYSTGD